MFKSNFRHKRYIRTIMTQSNSIVAKLSIAFVAIAMAFSLVAPAANAQVDTSSMSLEDLIALVNQLQAQIAGQSGDSGSMVSGSCNYMWTRSLSQGSTGQDVMDLQKFLNMDPDTVVALSGAGSPGFESSYYGALTASAVSKFQTKYSAEVLVPVGLVNPTGYFGPSTMAQANSVCAGMSASDDGDDSSDDDGSMDDGDDSSDDDDDALSGGESSIDNDFDAKSGDDTDLEEGQEDAPVMDVEFDVEDGDISVGRIDVAVDHTTGTETDPWDVFDTVSIWVDGDKIAEKDAGSKSDWEKDKPASGDYRIRFTGLDWVTREDATAEFTVGVTLQNQINGNTGTWDIFIPTQGIRGQDSLDINQYTGDTTDTVSFSFSAEGGDDELVVKSSSDDPEATTLQLDTNSDSSWLTIMAFDLDTDDSVNPITIETLPVGVVLSSSTFGSIIDDARLTIDGTVINDYSHNDGDSSDAVEQLNFDVDDSVTIDAGDRVTAILEVKFNSLDNGNQGMTIYGTTTGSFITADGADDLTGSQLSGSVNNSGDAHTLRTAGAVLEFVSATESKDTNSDSTTADDEGVFTIKFDVTAFETDIFVTKTAASGTAGTAGVDYRITDGSGGLSAGEKNSSTSASLSSTADTDGSRYKINEGDTETFTLTVTHNPVTSAFYGVQLYGFNWKATNGAADTTQLFTPASDYETDPLSI